MTETAACLTALDAYPDTYDAPIIEGRGTARAGGLRDVGTSS